MRDTGRRTCFIKFVHELRMYHDTYIYIYTYIHGRLQSIRNKFINRLVVRVVVEFKVYKNIEKRYL